MVQTYVVGAVSAVNSHHYHRLHYFGHIPLHSRWSFRGSGCPGLRFAAVLRTAPASRSLPIPHLLLSRLSVAPDPTRQRARSRPITRTKRLRRHPSLPKPTARAGRHSTAGATLRCAPSFAAYLRSFVSYACRLPPLRSVPRPTHPPAVALVTPAASAHAAVPRRPKKGPTPPVSTP